MSAWPEVEACVHGRKQGLKVTGSTLSKRLAESGEQLPQNVFDDLAQLITSLELSGSAACEPALRELPTAVCNLERLMELIASSNHISCVPSGISRLQSLRTLMLNKNDLTSLPEEMGQLVALQTLHVENNQLTVLPSSLRRLDNLIYANASYNCIRDFPDALCALPKLGTLILSHNNLQRVAENIKNLPSLHSLELKGNQLTELPSALGDCSKLKSLILDDNPLNDKKLIKIIRENKVRNTLAHIKKFGTVGAKQESHIEIEETTPSSGGFSIQGVHEKAEVYVSANVKAVRQSIVCAVLCGVQFTPATYERFISLQTELHQSLCDKRRLAAIGTHDLSKCELPLYYEALKPKDIKFKPLHRDVDLPQDEAQGNLPPTEEITGDRLKTHFGTDATMQRYLTIIGNQATWAVLCDAQHRVLSLPPVINSDLSRLDMNSTDILLEVSSPGTVDFCKSVAQEFLEQFAEVMQEAGQQLQVAPVRVLSDDGHQRHVFPRA